MVFGLSILLFAKLKGFYMAGRLKKFFGKFIKKKKPEITETKDMTQSDLVDACLNLVENSEIYNIDFNWDSTIESDYTVDYRIYVLSKEPGKYNYKVGSEMGSMYDGYIFEMNKYCYDKNVGDVYEIKFQTKDVYSFYKQDGLENHKKAKELYNLCNEKLKQAEIERKKQTKSEQEIRNKFAKQTEQQKLNKHVLFLRNYGIKK